MGWQYKIDLGNWVETVEHGQPVRSTTWTTVFADKRSVRQSEFYDAANVGLRPELMFVVNAHEYVGHESVRYPSATGSEYDIIRTYEQGHYTELICVARTGEMNG